MYLEVLYFKYVLLLLASVSFPFLASKILSLQSEPFTFYLLPLPLTFTFTLTLSLSLALPLFFLMIFIMS